MRELAVSSSTYLIGLERIQQLNLLPQVFSPVMIPPAVQAEVGLSADKLLHIGRLTPFNHHIYVATGFSLWGMSKGTMSGMLLSDLVLGINNPWADLYDATRATPFLTQESLRENNDVATRWVGDRFKGLQFTSLTEVASGEGKLVTVNGEQLAAY